MKSLVERSFCFAFVSVFVREIATGFPGKFRIFDLFKRFAPTRVKRNRQATNGSDPPRLARRREPIGIRIRARR